MKNLKFFATTIILVLIAMVSCGRIRTTEYRIAYSYELLEAIMEFTPPQMVTFASVEEVENVEEVTIIREPIYEISPFGREVAKEFLSDFWSLFGYRYNWHCLETGVFHTRHPQTQRWTMSAEPQTYYWSGVGTPWSGFEHNGRFFDAQGNELTDLPFVRERFCEDGYPCLPNVARWYDSVDLTGDGIPEIIIMFTPLNSAFDGRVSVMYRFIDGAYREVGQFPFPYVIFFLNDYDEIIAQNMCFGVYQNFIVTFTSDGMELEETSDTLNPTWRPFFFNDSQTFEWFWSSREKPYAPRLPLYQRTRIVVAGDTLPRIARQHFGEFDVGAVMRIAEANDLFRNDLFIGQVLLLPYEDEMETYAEFFRDHQLYQREVHGSYNNTRMEARLLPSRPVTAYVTHEVVEGDTLANIVKLHLGNADITTLQRVMTVNNITNPNNVQIGRVLIIPKD